MKTPKYLTVFALIAALSLTAVSCGDDPASSNDEDPPEMPTFENAQPDISYFDGEIPSDSPAYSASIQVAAATIFSNFGTIYTSSMSEADRDNADFKDGTWVWTYNYTVEGQTVEIRLESEDRGDETYWAMIWNYDGPEGTVEDYTMMEGTRANDGSYGNWTFNDLNTETGEETVFMESNWTWEDENNGETVTKIYDDGVLQGSYTYVQAGSEFTFTITSVDNENDIVIYWEEGGGGYYQEGTTKTCWDSSYAEVECG